MVAASDLRFGWECHRLDRWVITLLATRTAAPRGGFPNGGEAAIGETERVKEGRPVVARNVNLAPGKSGASKTANPRNHHALQSSSMTTSLANAPTGDLRSAVSATSGDLRRALIYAERCEFAWCGMGLLTVYLSRATPSTSFVKICGLFR